MENQIDPQLLEFLQTLPPEVRDAMLQRIVNEQSRHEVQDGRDIIRTPGEGGSTIVPRQGEMEPTMIQALMNQLQKRSKSKMIGNPQDLEGLY